MALVEAQVDFIVIGGVGAVLQGVPTTTFDLDIVHARSDGNRKKLFEVLLSLEACYRQHLPRRLLPTEDDLSSDGHMLLMTSAGPMDVLGRVVGDLDYDDLLQRSHWRDLRDGSRIRVLDLEALIELKEKTGREKDLAQLPLLRRTLREREER